MIKAASRAKNSLVFDPLDNSKTMIRVNDLVADLKCHGSPCCRKLSMEGRSRAGSSLIIAHSARKIQREVAEKRPFPGTFARASCPTPSLLPHYPQPLTRL